MKMPGLAGINIELPPGVMPNEADLREFRREEQQWTISLMLYYSQISESYINKFDIRLRPLLKNLRSHHAPLHYADRYYLFALPIEGFRSAANDIAAAAESLR